MISIIAALARNNVIGNKGQIPWKIKGEQNRFKELTAGKIVIMGKRSFEEIGKPLPNRTTIVISNTAKFEYENCTTLGSLAEAIEYIGDKDAFIAGGEQLYLEALPLADRLYLTRIDLEVEGDTFFPEYDEELFQLIQEEYREAEIPYTYLTYERRGYQPFVLIPEDKRYIAEKGNISLRLADRADSKLLCAWWNDGKVMAHAGFPKGLNTTVNHIIGQITSEDENYHRLILEVKQIRIGEMSYRIREREAEIGVKICNSSYREQGIGTIALRLLIEHLFSEKHVDMIHLDTNLENTRAQHVYEKLGFCKVKVHIDSWRDQLGELQSFVEYELGKENYIFSQYNV